MAKGIGLIGNFKGKVGNTVGYKLTASNNGQTQGIRVYQPIVKNPKSAGQAEQRAKLLAVNATYRALKMVIDRGNEGLPYGNKSRLAWLKTALKAEKMPWFEKGTIPSDPVGCPLTKGSLNGINAEVSDDSFFIPCQGVTAETSINTVGALSTALKAAYAFLKDGDQVTIVMVGRVNNQLASDVRSIVISTTDTTALTEFGGDTNKISVGSSIYMFAGAVIISRQGDNGEHLRSNTTLQIDADHLKSAPYDATSKAAAIASYRASAASNSDWAEESIQ